MLPPRARPLMRSSSPVAGSSPGPWGSLCCQIFPGELEERTRMLSIVLDRQAQKNLGFLSKDDET